MIELLIDMQSIESFDWQKILFGFIFVFLALFFYWCVKKWQL